DSWMAAFAAGTRAFGRRVYESVARRAGGIALDASGPANLSGRNARLVFAIALLVSITASAVLVYVAGPGVVAAAWLAVGPLAASLVLSPRITAVLAGWTLVLGLGLGLGLAEPGALRMAVSHLSVLMLLVAFAVANAVLRAAAQRRLGQVRAVARVAQSALLREVPAAVTAGRLASRYVSASAEARVGGDVLEVVADPVHPRWLVGDTRGKGLPAVRLASIAMTSFRDACAQPGLSLPEVARVVDQSVTRAASEEDFVTAVFAELDPGGWLQLVTCGHPPPLRLAADGELRALTPGTYATPLGLRPDMQPSTFSVSAGDRLLFYTDGLLEARDREGRYFRLEDCLDTLRHPDLQAAVDGLLDRLLSHARRNLDDDVALLLLEAAPPACPGQDEPAVPAPGRPAVAGQRPLQAAGTHARYYCEMA
ncbi:MAG TPA: PP2C family protein-serine/threonine phosphatase, partial [Streptosporangiaceae bacterium]|nr:PP2C family protein-serine/threonine phosphatase [Streptosporangiaceae bacterium]